jgi:hypothetical protein
METSNKNKLLLHSGSVPSKVCGDCKLAIIQTADHIGCSECFVWFHVKCKVKNRSSANRLSRLTSWFCSNICETNYKASESNKYVEDTIITIPENPTIKDLA